MSDNRYILDSKGRRLALLDNQGNLSREAMARYLADGLSSEDRAKVDMMADNDPMTREALDGLLKAPMNHSATIASLMTEIANRSGATVLSSNRPEMNFPWLRIAAGIAVIAVAIAIGLISPRWFERNKLAEAQPVSSTEPETAPDDIHVRLETDETPITMESGIEDTPQSASLENVVVQDIQNTVKHTEEAHAKKKDDKERISGELALQEKKKDSVKPMKVEPATEVSQTISTSGAVATDKFSVAAAARTLADSPAKPMSYDKVETPARFPGGDLEMFRFIKLNRNFPEPLRNEGIKGSVLVKFTINVDGRMDNIDLLEGFHPVLDQDALRVIRAMPRWAPAEHDGKKVTVVRTVAINYD